MNYGIKLESNRFVEWIDENWFGTSKELVKPFFSKEEALDAVRMMMKHYHYHVILVSDEGETVYDFGKPVQKIAVQQTTGEPEEEEISLF